MTYDCSLFKSPGLRLQPIKCDLQADDDNKDQSSHCSSVILRIQPSSIIFFYLQHPCLPVTKVMPLLLEHFVPPNSTVLAFKQGYMHVYPCASKFALYACPNSMDKETSTCFMPFLTSAKTSCLTSIDTPMPACNMCNACRTRSHCL